jgi:invasion protein IalB
MMTARFRDRALRTIAVLFLTAGFAGGVAAQAPQSQGSFVDWNVWELDEGGQKICYIVSEPTKQDGNYTRRGKAAVLVTRRPTPAVTDEVSVQPGYTYLEGSSVGVDVVGQSQFTLFTRGAHAWTKNETEDQALIRAMKAGSKMVIQGESSKNTNSLDEYSLIGFTDAYNAMVEACSR